jgi:hypothetical protein
MARSRLFVSGLTTRCSAALLVATCASFTACPAAEAASPSGGGWKAASPDLPFSSDVAPATYTSPTSSSPSARADSASGRAESTRRWRMPNAQTAAGRPQTVIPATHETERQVSSVASHYEPQAFLPSTTTKPLATAKTRDAAPNAAVQKHAPSAAIAASSAAAPPRKPVSPVARHASNNHFRPIANQSRPRGFGPPREQSSSYSSKLWQTINVAFDGPDQLTNEPENLPLPAQRPNQSRLVPPMHEEILPTPGGYYEQGEGPYFAHGEPGACGGDCGGECGTACGDGMCGCGDDAGCACEPSCGCPCGCGAETPCILACGDDVCLMGEGDAEACHTIRIGVPKWQELTVFGGVHGFKGPYDRTRDSGNFGFHEGFNTGFKVPFSDFGYQIGYQAAHSQLSGSQMGDISDPHTQQFVTVGMFRRETNGIQLGLAWDLLRDERFGAVDFHQLRGELSLIDRGCHEFGLALAAHLNEHEASPATPNNPSTVYQATDQYLLFYRFHGARGGEGRFYGGFNDDADAIIGSDLLIPIQDRWSLATGFTYLIPEEDAGVDGAAHEAWNLGINLVWHWDCRARKCHSNPYRPLFNVADNGYLIVDERPGASL